MRQSEPTRVIDLPLILGESPVWDEERGVLWFIDITAQLIWRLDPESGALARHALPAEVGSIGLATEGRLVVALRSGVHLFDPATAALEFLVHPEPDHPVNRLNDGKVGPDGNFWVGSMDARPCREATAALYRVTPAGGVTRIVDGIRVSNGLAWSPDNRRMYHADSRGAYVQTFDFDPGTGEVGAPQVLLHLSEAQGYPDGAAVDVDGFYWSAGISAGVLNRISPQGEIVEVIRLPVTAPTMPCFGGADMRTLFVTSLASARTGQHEDGSLIALRVETPGLPGFRFGVGAGPGTRPAQARIGEALQ